MIDWVDPRDGAASSTIVRLETGDVLNITSQPHGRSYRPPTLLDDEPLFLDPGRAWVQTHSSRYLYDAEQKARQMQQNGFDFTAIAASRNGWYAVVIGSLSQSQGDLVDLWKGDRLIPADALLTRGERFFTIATTNPNTSVQGEQETAQPQQCSVHKEEELREACYIMFSGELGCNVALSGELNDVTGRSAASSVICAAAVQALVQGNIDLTSAGISLLAGITDDLSESFGGSDSLMGLFLGAAEQGVLVGGLGYCLSTVEEQCSR